MRRIDINNAKTQLYEMAIRRILAVFLMLAIGTGTALAVERPAPLVTTVWLACYIDAVVVLDIRTEPRSFGAPQSKADAMLFAATPLKGLTGHIPSAVAVRWKPLFGKRTESGIELMGMLP